MIALYRLLSGSTEQQRSLGLRLHNRLVLESGPNIDFGKEWEEYVNGGNDISKLSPKELASRILDAFIAESNSSRLLETESARGHRRWNAQSGGRGSAVDRKIRVGPGRNIDWKMIFNKGGSSGGQSPKTPSDEIDDIVKKARDALEEKQTKIADSVQRWIAKRNSSIKDITPKPVEPDQPGQPLANGSAAGSQ
jgi:hypothetical protein